MFPIRLRLSLLHRSDGDGDGEPIHRLSHFLTCWSSIHRRVCCAGFVAQGMLRRAYATGISPQGLVYRVCCAGLVAQGFSTEAIEKLEDEQFEEVALEVVAREFERAG